MNNRIGKIGLALTLLAALLIGCEEQPEPVQTTEPPAVEVFDPVVFLREIEPAIECLQSWDDELFGAEPDFESPMLAGLLYGRPAVLYPEQEPLPEGYEQDPSYASYFPVQNYSSLDQVHDYLSSYMEEDVIRQTHYAMDFFEYDGGLYLIRGSRGYGALQYDPDTVRYLGEKDGLRQVGIVYKLFDEYSSDAVISFCKTETGWKIAAAENRK